MKINNVNDSETIRTLLSRVLKRDSWNLFPGIRTHAWKACGYKGIPTRDFHEMFNNVARQFMEDWHVRWQYGI